MTPSTAAPRQARHRRIVASAVLLALAGLLAGPARADIALDAKERVFLFGDLRLRLESDWSSTAPDGTERADRDRVRARARLGFRFQPAEKIGLLIRARSGNTNSQNSPHVTIIQSGDNGDADILIDRAWVQLKGKMGWASLGRNGMPFSPQSEHLYDDDIWFDGVAFGFDWGAKPDKHLVRGAVGSLPEGEASLSWDEEGMLTGVQYSWQRSLERGSYTVAAGLHVIQDDDAAANPVLLDQDWCIWALSFQRVFKPKELPLTLGVDVFHNSDAPSAGTWNRDERDAHVLSFQAGSAKEKGDWLVGYWFAHVEKFAVVPHLAQDDWLRWGSGTQTRSSNYDGHELRFVYTFTKSMNLMARLFSVDGIELETPAAVAKEDGMRFRVDFNWKF